MVDILNKTECSGCCACQQICPKSCIRMITDEEGFWYPKVYKSQCINCHLCEKACPIITPSVQASAKQPVSYAAINKNEAVRAQSSSGGVFTALAECIISVGGAVFGAAFQEDFSVSHICVETVNDLGKLRGSKYLQSKIGDSYTEAKQLLDCGRLVLFTGTPCQIEGLLSFLGKGYDNLYTQDLICHGVPSPLVWRKYVKYREKKENSKTQSLFFRDKEHGWRNYSVHFEFKNHAEYNQTHHNDLFMTAFLKNWCLRPSCYHCHFKKEKRLSDITLADFWGIENVAPRMDDDKGSSLIHINSSKGEYLYNQTKDGLLTEKVDFEKSIAANPSMITSCSKPKERNEFFKKIARRSFEKCVTSFQPKVPLSRKVFLFFARQKRRALKVINLLKYWFTEKTK